ncbi:DUF3500 domain-containing protein [Maribacter polysiphoniae]|uniref:DUF3500 domain-containing protein n=1 Tax=Maribacter polysiphoniae TaxID=429344 RepID=A0A316DUU4_9FLAO|nr:DUF3500 domain-containing protein [Maribacter polysiphoniae]MBD1262566.1 DUF3500 domain-containing protein [Maribacter polysiphoniae]PWK21238.1 uncharacterized protein DUF3500 [Maribacter polysiphoniae]
MKNLIILFLFACVFGCKEKVYEKGNSKTSDNIEVVNPVKERFAKMEADALKEPYAGIFTEDNASTNIFQISSTGVSTLPIQITAKDFLNSLSPVQLQRSTFDIDDEEWRKWCNVDNGIYDRQGVSLKELNEIQKKDAFNLIKESLSAKGLQLSKDIMKTDQTLKELNNGSLDYDEELYFLTIMGTPSSSEPWGWQLDGHHLVINYFILGDQVVMSPVFMGGEPIITTSGKYKGNTLFQDEQNFGLALMQSLTIEQKKDAIISNTKTGDNNVAEANKDNLTLNYQGIQVSKFSNEQKQKLLGLIFLYISNIREGHDKVKMDEVTENIDNTWFSWVGDTSEDAIFYYRIHSPVVLIEFDHQRVVGVPNADDGKPSKNHIHTVVRTPNGNDYGKDLLKQHKEKHHH